MSSQAFSKIVEASQMSALHIDTLLQPPSQVSNYERRIFAFFCKPDTSHRMLSYHIA
jgi:hypothetical protein